MFEFVHSKRVLPLNVSALSRSVVPFRRLKINSALTCGIEEQLLTLSTKGNTPETKKDDDYTCGSCLRALFQTMFNRLLLKRIM